jgi:hypothetical protein
MREGVISLVTHDRPIEAAIVSNASMDHHLAIVAVPSGDLLPARAHAELLTAWLARVEQEVAATQRSAATLITYRRSIRTWESWLRQSGITQPAPLQVTEFLTAAGANRAPATRNRHLHALRSCYLWTENQGLYPAIARSARSLVVNRNEPLPCFSREHMEAPLRAVSDAPEIGRARSPGETARAEATRLRDKALIRVMFGTGYVSSRWFASTSIISISRAIPQRSAASLRAILPRTPQPCWRREQWPVCASTS